MSIDRSKLLRVSSAPEDGKGARTYYLDEDNGVTYADKGGKLEPIADLRTYDESGTTRDMGAADVHIPSALANYAAGYKLEGGIADVVAPVVMVDKASDYFYTFDKDDAFQPAQDLAATEGERVKEISPRLSSTLFSTVGYALASFIPQGVIANADAPLNPRLAAIGRIMNAMSIGREMRTSAIFTTSAFAGFTTALTSTTKWNGGTASDPKADLNAAEEAALQNPTNVVFGNKKVWNAFVANPNIAKYGQYKELGGGGSQFDPAKVAGLLDIPVPVIGKMKSKSASAGTYGYVWPNVVLSMHQQPGTPADMMTIGVAKTFRWRKGGLAGDANGFRVRSFFDPTRGPDGGEVVVVAVNEVPVLTGAQTSYLITNVLG